MEEYLAGWSVPNLLIAANPPMRNPSEIKRSGLVSLSIVMSLLGECVNEKVLVHIQ